MNPERFTKALEEISALLCRESAVVSAAVFGSVARDEATDDSDLDLVLVLGDRVLESKRRDLWEMSVSAAARHDVTASILFTDRKLRGLDVQLAESIMRHARPLKGELPDPGLKALRLRPMRLIRYHLKGLKQHQKLRLNRLLFGWETLKRVGKKRYRSRKRGLLEILGGARVGSGALLIPEANAGEVERALVSYGAKRLVMPIWEQAR